MTSAAENPSCTYAPLVFVFYSMPVGITRLFFEDR